MPTWEFLLQKKGDKSWLPLESPTLEILEGEYRLAAKSSVGNIPAHIQVDYLPSAEQSDRQLNRPLHRQLNRDINAQGLLLIVPFLSFNVGSWEIKCTVDDFETKSLKIEVLEAIASDWDFFDQITEPVIPALQSEISITDPLTQIELAELELVLIANAKPLSKAPFLPSQLITLEQTEFTVKGEATIEITGESYLSGEIDIILKDAHTKIAHNQYTHNVADSDFFSYSITIPEQLETQILSGEVRIRPHQHIEQNKHIVSQSVSINYQAIVDPFRKFPILPFEKLPTHVPIQRNIKFPELPEFLTLGIRNKSKAVLAKPKKPIPNWDIATPYKIPNYGNSNDLRFEFE